ncbi:MAG: translational machinery protein [Alphaproteobacteria bacterium]|nr:translational machinery protein [Alphaproteobacteria bacterium]
MCACSTVVWLNAREARFAHFSTAGAQAEPSGARPFRIRRHGCGQPDTTGFHQAVAAALAGAQAILLVGPGDAKLAFLRHLAAHQPALERQVVGVETVAGGDGCLTEFARQYFSHRRANQAATCEPAEPAEPGRPEDLPAAAY